MSVLQSILSALRAPEFAGASISMASPSWEVTDTGQEVTIGGDIAVVKGDYGHQLTIRDTKDTIYFSVGNDKDGNTLYDATATRYKIVFMKYVGKSTDKKSCFKAIPII
jgi:hypothetical protein